MMNMRFPNDVEELYNKIIPMEMRPITKVEDMIKREENRGKRLCTSRKVRKLKRKQDEFIEETIYDMIEEIYIITDKNVLGRFQKIYDAVSKG